MCTCAQSGHYLNDDLNEQYVLNLFSFVVSILLINMTELFAMALLSEHRAERALLRGVLQ